MTVQTNTNVASFLGNGAATYPIGFKFNSAADLVVQKTVIATGVTTTLTLNSDYSVAGAGVEEGGSITFSQAPTSAESIKVTRVVDLLQLTDLRNQGKFYAEVHEAVFDKLVMIDQQQQTEIDDANAKSDEAVATANAANAKSDQAVAKAAQNLIDMQAQYDAFEQGAALYVIGDYAAGLVISAYNKIFRKDGEFYRAAASLDLPYTLTGNWATESVNFVSVGDDVLRQDLANATDPAKGATMVAYGYGTVADTLDEIVSGAVTEPLVNAKVDMHDHNPNAHSELRSNIIADVSANVAAEANRAESAASTAEAARDAAFVNADVYPDIATGLAAVTDGEQFQVVEGDEIVRYRRGSASTQTEMARYPSSGKVDSLASALPPMVRQARDVSHGLAVTELGEQFIVSSQNGTVLYQTIENLFDPSTVVEGRYIVSTTGASNSSTGWAHTDYIRVVPGTDFSIASNTERRVGVAFYTENKDWTGDHNGASDNPLTLEVPATAAYVRFNVKSPTVPQPTEIMANDGVPYPYMPFGVKGANVVTETLSKAVLSQVLDFYTSDNLFVPGNVEQNRYMQSTGSFSIGALAGWGIFVVPASEGDVFTVYSPSGEVRRRGAAFFDVVSPNVGDTPIQGSYNDSGDSITVTAPAGTQSFVINTQSPAQPLPDDLMIVRGSTQIPYMPPGDLVFVKKSSIRPEIADSGSEAKKLSFTFNGTEGATSSIASESGLTRRFIAIPAQDPLSTPARFNMRADLIDGAVLRDGPDDIAPDHIDGATVGANHGYSLGVCTAVSHGKVPGDSGSIWSNGGLTCVLADVPNANTVLLARESSNGAVPAGTYTHVSGATNTADITVTSVSMSQWYPPHKNWSVRALADGSEVVPSAEPISADKVQFIEQADILARADIIDAWIADGGMPAGYEPNAPASIAQTITYEYDKRGQITIARDWLTVKNILVSDLMGLQFARNGSEEQYIVPGSVPFDYNGVTLDYSMGVAADYTLASGASVYMDSTKLQSSGEYAHRVLVVYPNAVFAIGLLPVGDAAYDVRRDRTSNIALEIRGNTGKLYFRVLDIGSHTSTVGDQYSAIGYRHILPRSTERTAFYAVDGGGATWVYADWHNKAGLDRLPIDQEYPELIGRTFEVVEARNVTAKAGVLAGSLPVIVNAAASSATLILRVQ